VAAAGDCPFRRAFAKGDGTGEAKLCHRTTGDAGGGRGGREGGGGRKRARWRWRGRNCFH
jgi:hypothetical protein